jgi:hypothetical protein
MPEPMTANSITLIQSLVEKLGIPVALSAVLFWWAYTTVKWEREKMLPAIERNTAVLEDVEQAIERVLKQ